MQAEEWPGAAKAITCISQVLARRNGEFTLFAFDDHSGTSHPKWEGSDSNEQCFRKIIIRIDKQEKEREREYYFYEIEIEIGAD